MKEISSNKINNIDAYWIHYTKEDREEGHIQLSACANNYALLHGASEGELKCVGLRYEADGFGCYELFNVGHTLIKCPLKPGVGQSLLAVFRGKNAAELQREEYLAIERTLNEHGWMTRERE